MVEIEEFPLSLAEGDAIEPMVQVPSVLPALPLRDIVIYPFMSARLRRSFMIGFESRPRLT